MAGCLHSGSGLVLKVQPVDLYLWLTKVTEHSHVTTNPVDTMSDRIQALLDANGGPY